MIFDPVGGEYAEPAFRSIAWRGRYLVVGFANGEIPKLPFNLALLKGASIVGVFWGDHMKREAELGAAAFRAHGRLDQGGQAQAARVEARIRSTKRPRRSTTWRIAA